MFAGLDIGSTNAKFSIYEGGGRLLAEASSGYILTDAGESLTTEAIWNAVQHVIGTACKQLPVKGQITAMAITTFGESLVPVDSNGRVLSDRFTCSSIEGDEELKEILEAIPAEEIRNISGVFPHKRFPLVKMLWFKYHSPLYEKISRYLTMEDFIIHRLTGRFALSDSSAARTMAYDRKNHCWSRVLLELPGVEVDKLSEILPSGAYVGTVLQEVCYELGLWGKIKVFTGGHDQMCNSIGAGLCGSDMIVNCSGTVECISGIANLKQAEAIMQALPLQFAPFPEQSESCFTFWAPVAGCSSLDWCLRLTSGCFQMKDRELAERHISIQAICSDKPSPLLTAPYFTGRNYPDYAGQVSGFVSGMNLQTTPEELYQSIMEGITFELKICLERFGELSAGGQKMIVVGGGAQSDYWMQMKANITKQQIVRLKHRQSGTMGSMLLAAVGAGYYRDLGQATAECVKVKKIFHPEKRLSRIYEEKFEQYLNFRNSMEL